MRTTRLLCRTAVAALTFPCPTIALDAQNSGGSIQGVVQDSTKARIAGSAIEVTRPDSSQTRHMTADAQGEFRIEGLTPGDWHVRIESRGFAIAAVYVSVAVSTVRDIVVTLRPSQLSQSVRVTWQGSSIATQPIDLASNVHRAVVTTDDLEGMPLPARSFANIAYLAPGTESVKPSDATKARITAVSTRGRSGLNNELSVDGGDNSDDWIGGILQNFSPDSIEEFAMSATFARIPIARRPNP